ncbi:MAG: SUMF1/EgtB/PvdO family nonheme iron enzyme [Chloroflexi bacterium]|nr:SUMF1/EgtB/PvdO family nonheme iron enzyme [Ardenticatenaceae bacterium]MBL1130094.1 NACHT domain-containing protein [Chloroflexota bacterium]NOG36180.1 SUMF1/EgtB/PvdO family nonheme iron enzyme [Chloroflexota bacterium]GIK54869.1 MAG: hypothetical protein BroJett015_05320 [Chloroflexota bacterium]
MSLPALPALRDLLNQHFNDAELRQLTFDLGIEYENLPGPKTRIGKSQALVEYCLRHGRLPDLITRCQTLRPHVAWADAAALLTGGPLPQPWQRYYQQIIDENTGPRYQLDRRFVRLTLLLDQGQDNPIRYIPDARRPEYDDLGRLLEEVKDEDRILVLLGKPGGGKTTLLRRLQLEHAQAAQGGQATVPFFLPLNAYRSETPGQPPPAPLEWLALEWHARHPNLPDFHTIFHEGQFLLLLDGLNEIPHRDKTDYLERIGQWQLFLQRAYHHNNIILFSCRSLDYSSFLSSEAAPVRQIDLQPLTPPQIQEFLEDHLGNGAAAVWPQIEHDSERLELFATPFFLRLLVEQVQADPHGQMPDGQAALLTGFVRRAVAREVAHSHRLFKPGVLLSEDDLLQVSSSAWATPTDLPTEGPLFSRLAALAYAMQIGRPGYERGTVRREEKDAHQLLDHPQAADILAAGYMLNLLEKDIRSRTITFYHQLWQEYFAARVLATAPQPNLVSVPWQADQMKKPLAEPLAEWLDRADISDRLPDAPTTGWEETTVLAAAMTANPAPLVRDLIHRNLPLAVRCAAAPEVKNKLPAELIAELQQALLTHVGVDRADLRARIAAARALADLGDPRFIRQMGPHGPYLRPPLVSVPGGVYMIGDDGSQYDDEKPAHTVEVTALAMGVFPVTNAEYRLFWEAGGYKTEQWWQTEAARAWLKGELSNEGVKQLYRERQQYLQGFSEDVIRAQKTSPEQVEFWLWQRNATFEQLDQYVDKWYRMGEKFDQPLYWYDSNFNHAAQPVVGVCWFEAQAYCAWLSAQTGERYTLPTEAEWEAAARGPHGRAYPYGPTFDPARSNTFETHVRRTTPVGVFPGGRTPDGGIADLSGNVWEWTSSQYQPYPYNAADGREDSEGDARRVLRGGSWFNFQNLARAAARLNLTPDNRSNYVGFRVVVRRPPSHPDH